MFNKIIDKFEGGYKTSLIAKKRNVFVYVYEDYIGGTGAVYFEGKFFVQDFNIEYQYLKEINESVIAGNRCLSIDYIDVNSLSNNKRCTVLLPNIENSEEARKTILNVQKEFNKERAKRIEQEQAKRDIELIEQQKYKEDCQQYYISCYNFHIADNKNPYFELRNDDFQFIGIYIDKNKNLNFLTIDGYSKEENNAYIPYDKIHYYEKAGSVHYTSSISGDYSSYGGSFTGATISEGVTALSGLLFGTMGLAAGALLTYSPSKMDMPSSILNISSETQKIDDRSVILNYYSSVKQQYMDVELPADIYNFLQTYLPEKKYGIVMEIEKKNAVKMQESNSVAIEKKETERITQNDDIDIFQKRIKKLKIMYDNGILSEEEFMNEKKRILSEI